MLQKPHLPRMNIVFFRDACGALGSDRTGGRADGRRSGLRHALVEGGKNDPTATWRAKHVEMRWKKPGIGVF